MKIKKDLKNELMKRQELVVEIQAEKNPTYEETKKQIAEQLKKPEENIDIKTIKGSFGKKTFRAKAYIYDSKQDLENMKKLELTKKQRKEKNKPAEPSEEKTAEETKEAPVSEEKPAEEAPAEQTEIPKETKPDTTPIEEKTPEEQPKQEEKPTEAPIEDRPEQEQKAKKEEAQKAEESKEN